MTENGTRSTLSRWIPWLEFRPGQAIVENLRTRATRLVIVPLTFLRGPHKFRIFPTGDDDDNNIAEKEQLAVGVRYYVNAIEIQCETGAIDRVFFLPQRSCMHSRSLCWR